VKYIELSKNTGEYSSYGVLKIAPALPVVGSSTHGRLLAQEVSAIINIEVIAIRYNNLKEFCRMFSEIVLYVKLFN
jgi:hypothetical protein